MDKIRMVIADDDPDMLATTSALFKSNGIDVVAEASDAETCLALIESHDPHVAVVDAHMPTGGGLRVCREVRHNSGKTQVLAWSGSGDMPLILDMLRAGAIGYVVKGTNPATIVEAVRRAARGDGTLPIEIANSLLKQLRYQDAADPTEAQRLYGADLNTIIDEGAFDVVFQPVVDLTSGRVTAVEALSRFERGSPEEWFTRAWSIGRGVDLEVAALQKALRRQDDLPDGAYLSLNVSPDTLSSARLRECIGEADPHRVVIEITEHAPIEHETLFRTSLAGIRELGVRVALDDAGAGYANFVRMIQVAPEIIKLDKGLITDLDKLPMKQAVAKSMVTFAQNIGAELVGEGVERAGEMRILTSLGIEFGQGFLLARPGPLPTPSSIDVASF